MKKKKMDKWIVLLLMVSFWLGMAGGVSAQKTDAKEVKLWQNEGGRAQKESDKNELLPGQESKETKEQKETVKAGKLQWVEESEPAGSGMEAESISSPEEETNRDSEEVRVFIELEGASALEQGFSARGIGENSEAQDCSKEMEEHQKLVLDKIQHAVNEHRVDIRYQFSLLTNAVSAVVQYKDIEKIQEVEGVKAVYLVPRYRLQETAKPNTYTAGQMVGISQAWDSGYTGAGQRIAIIDTGIDLNHPSFDPQAFSYGRRIASKKEPYKLSEEMLDKNKISKVFDRLKVGRKGNGVSPKKLYKNEKVAFAFNYSGRDLNVSSENGDHGTHVAGIAAANQYVPGENGTYQEQPDGVAGAARDAQLLVMKVFDKNDETYTDDYMAALEDALVLGADVVNLSIGTPNPGESTAYDGEEYVDGIFASFLKSDVVVSVSAGNNGSWADAGSNSHNRAEDVNMNMIGYPGSYTNALTVASAVNAGYTGYGFRFGKHTYFYQEAEDNGNIASMASLAVNGTETRYEYAFLESYGAEKDYQGKNVRGKIVFVSKGGISYANKHENAQKAGAKALIIYSDDLQFPKLSLSDSKAEIPCAIISGEDSWDLQMESKNKVVGILPKPVPNSKVTEGYRVSSFSAWGVPGDLSLKPEITAPGENIYSTLNNGSYGCMSGTSMAAPSVAGMSALVSEYIERTGLEQKTGLSRRTLIQSLLMSTAVPLKEEDREEYSPRKQGSGLANVRLAVSSPSYLLIGKKEGNDGKVKAELGDDPDRKGEYEFSFQVCNISDKNQYYTLDSSILTEELLEGEWIAGSSHKLQPKVEFSSEDQVLLYDLNGDRKVDREDVMQLLRHVNQSLPLQRVECNQEKFDFHKDGVIDTADVYGFLQALEMSAQDFQEMVLEVKDTAQVSVKATLSEKDRKYLNSRFKHGMYIDGFIYLRGAVELSIPVLAFYGNWTESSMFEPFDYLEFYNGGKQEAATYSDVNVTNYLNYYSVEADSVCRYGSNLYLKGGDKKYLPDRNAFSTNSGDRIDGVSYTLIRNAAAVETSIVNDKTGEIYYQSEEEKLEGAYYDAKENRWCNKEYLSSLDWQGKNRQGKPLPEGTRVRFIVTALPEYYRNNPKKAAEGAKFSVPVTIDNTKPRLIAMEDEAPGKIRLTFQDNRYTAAVKVYDRDRETLLKAYGVNQNKPGISMQVTINDPKKVFYLYLVDYAGNTVSYRVNRSESPDTVCTDGVVLNRSEMKIIKNNTQRLKAVVSPEGVLDDTVIFHSEDCSIASVDQKGVVTGQKPGITRIIATTNAKNAAGKPETAVCQVTVEEIAVSLNGILWDADGKTWFGNVNTAYLPDYTKLSQVKKNRCYAAAAAVKNKILAVEGKQESSNLYLIDPANKYKTTLKGELDFEISDLAYGPNADLVFSVQGTDLNYFESEDIHAVLGYAGVDEVTSGDKLVGISYAGSSNEAAYGLVDWFYVVSQRGNLYKMGYSVKNEDYIYKDILQEVGNTGISTGDEWIFNSLYYDPVSGYIFWSVYDGGDKGKMYALSCGRPKADTAVSTYYLGSFQEGDQPFVGLYGTSGMDGYSFGI
ncbi:MAG: S8 family serine peptidase [Lachnospiraceae bacterium]|nr:S8 family serine peptidase [Lachnospiraceae bacterium]